MSCIVTCSTFWKRLSPRLQQALIARRDGKFKDAIQLLYDACEQDKDPEAMYFMAVAYELGGWKYILADHKRAISWYVKAAQAGHAAAIAFVNSFRTLDVKEPEEENRVILPTVYNKTRDMLARGMEIICEDDDTGVSHFACLSEFLLSFSKIILSECNFHFSRFVQFILRNKMLADMIMRNHFRDFHTYFGLMMVWNEQSLYLQNGLWASHAKSKFRMLCAHLNVRTAKISVVEAEMPNCTKFEDIRKYAKWIADEGMVNEDMLDDNSNLNHIHLTEYYLYGERKLHMEAYRFYLSTNVFVQSRVFLWMWIGGAKHLGLIKDIVPKTGVSQDVGKTNDVNLPNTETASLFGIGLTSFEPFTAGAAPEGVADTAGATFKTFKTLPLP